MAFGTSVGIDGNLIAVGDPDYAKYYIPTFGGRGEVFIFKYENGSWSSQYGLVPIFDDPNHNFGESLSMNNGRLLISDPEHDSSSLSDIGSTYLFKLQPDGNYLAENGFMAVYGYGGGHFGHAVDLEDSYALIGEPYSGYGGYAYIHTFPAISAMLTATPAITPTGDTRLTWTTQNADTVTITPGIGEVGANGSMPVYIAEATSFVLTASGPDETAVAETTVTVGYPPPAATFTASPLWIRAGKTVALSWKVTDADTVTVSPEPGSTPADGKASVSPDETTTYTLTAIGPGGTTSRDVTVVVQQVPPTIAGISVAPASILLGESATLYWNAVNASSATLEPGGVSVPIDGSMTVSPDTKTTYSITVEGLDGTASADVTLKVNAPENIDLGVRTSPAPLAGAIPSAMGSSSPAATWWNHARMWHLHRPTGSVSASMRPTIVDWNGSVPWATAGPTPMKLRCPSTGTR